MLMQYEEPGEGYFEVAGRSDDPQSLTTATTSVPITVPTEVMRLIFGKLEPNSTLRLRKTCRAWMENIETMYIPYRHLLIYFAAGLEADDLARRFFATNLDLFKRLPIKAGLFPTDDAQGIDYGTTLSRSLLQRITSMFPHLEHLLVDTVLDVESVNAIISMLPSWTRLSSLSLFRAAHLPETRKVALRNALNRAHWIRRLGITDLGRQWWRMTIFDNLEHLAYESQEVECVAEEVVRQLGPVTYSLWMRCSNLSPASVERWADINPHFVQGLELLHIGDLIDFEDSDRAHVNVAGFISLSELRIQFECSGVGGVADSYIYATLDPTTFASMAGLSHLTRLELISFQFDLQALSDAVTGAGADALALPPLENVTQLTLTRFKAVATDGGAPGFSGVTFCRIFARLFPRLQKLRLAVIHQADGQAVEQSCPGHFFPRLTTFEYVVYVTPKSEQIAVYEFE